jgi:hypothetical protein
MRSAAIFILLATSACARYHPPAPATSRDGTPVAASFGRTWDAVIDEFAKRNIPIRTIERASGFIATEMLTVPVEPNGDRVHPSDVKADCGWVHRGYGIFPTHAVYNIVVRGDSARSVVRVTPKWTHVDYVKYAPVTTDCSSSGLWESSLEEGIKGRAESAAGAAATAGPTRAAETTARTPQPTAARPLNVTIRMRFVDPDSTVTPIPNLEVAVIGERGDTTRVTTNTLGVVSITLPAGRYRAVPMRLAEFDGKTYSWDVPFSVRMGMGAVDLTQRNAKVSRSPR